MKLNKYHLIVAVLLVAGSVALTRYYFPRIETQTVDVIKEVVKTDVRTITKIVERPDGTKETIIDHTDKSVENKDQKHTQTTFAKANWNISAGVSKDYTQILTSKEVYSIHVQRRILGPFFLGVTGNTNKEVGLTIGTEF